MPGPLSLPLDSRKETGGLHYSLRIKLWLKKGRHRPGSCPHLWTACYVLFGYTYCLCRSESACPLPAARSILTDAACGTGSQLSRPEAAQIRAHPVFLLSCPLPICRSPGALLLPLPFLEPSSSLSYNVQFTWYLHSVFPTSQSRNTTIIKAH